MNKPVITKIEFTKEILDEIDKIKKGEPIPRTRIIINKDGRSYECTLCGDYPAYRVWYDVGGAKLIERYCESCFKKWENKRR